MIVVKLREMSANDNYGHSPAGHLHREVRRDGRAGTPERMAWRQVTP
jgi:hypothetical protein